MEIKLPPLDKHDHPEPHTMVWSDIEIRAIRKYATAAVELNQAQRGEQMATLHITMERHDNGQSLAKSEPFRFVKASPIWRATEELPLGEYPLYTAPQPSQPSQPAHTESEVQEILRDDWNMSQDKLENTVRRILGVPKP